MNKKILFKPVLLWMRISFLFLGALFFACTSQRGVPDEDHSEHFDTVFLRVQNIAKRNIPAAQAYLERAYAAFPYPGKIDLLRKYAYYQFYLADKGNNIRQAMLYADSMIALFEDPALGRRYPREYVKALFAKADVLREIKRYNESYSYLYKGREIMLPLLDTCLYHEFAIRLGLAYYRQGKYRDAAPYFAEATLQLNYCDTSSFDIFYAQQAMLDNAALGYDKAGDNKQALFYYDSTLHFIGQHGAKFSKHQEHHADIKAAIAVVEGNKGKVLLRLGDTLGAEALLQRSIAVNIAGRNEVQDAQLTMIALASLYLQSNRLADMNTVLQEMEASFRTVSTPAIRQNWRYLQWQYYEKTGQKASGYVALKDYIALRDTVEAMSTKPTTADVQEELERMDGEHRFALMQKDDALKTVYMRILIILVVAAVIVSWLIWRNWRRSRQHVRELKLLNSKIHAQHEHIRRSLTALEQSQQNHYRMMKIVAHDLSNPVSAIHTLTDLMIIDIETKGRINNKEYMELIRTSSANALALISDLLALDTSISDMEIEPIEIHVTLKYCVDLMQAKAAEKKQLILLQTEPATVMACREKMWRVFSNLLNNAIKFSPDSSTIEVGINKRNELVHIYVKDNGIGIPSDIQSYIFNEVTLAKRKGTRGEASFGLGLSISRQIIEAHKGRIWFETEEGLGTTFHIEMNVSDE